MRGREARGRLSGAVLFHSISGVAWLSSGNALAALSQWITVMVLARYCDLSVVGAYGLGNALAVPVFTLFGLQLRTVLSVDSLTRFSIQDYLVLRVLGIGAALCAAGPLFLVYTTDRQSVTIVLLVFAFRSIEALIDVVHGIFQRFDRLSVIGKALVLRSILTLGILWAMISWTRNSAAALLAALLGSCLPFLLYDLRYLSLLRNQFTTRRWRGLQPVLALAGTALPMAVAVFLTVFNGSIPRLVVERSNGVASLGIFSAVSYFAVPGAILLTSISQASAPGLAECFRAGRRQDFVGGSAHLLGVAATLALAGILVSFLGGGSLLGLAYGPAYRDYSRLLMAFTCASGLGYLGASLGVAVTAAGCFWPQLAVHAMLSFVLWGACLFLIPVYGLLGGAVGLGIANLIGLLAYGALLARIVGIGPGIQDCAAA